MMPEGAFVLVTRAEPGASETAARLEALGFRPLVSPALEIASIAPLPVPDLSDIDSLVFTSANGVRAFAALLPRRDLRVWSVGPATLAAAQEAGFSQVACAHGDSDRLANAIIETDPAGAAGYLHVANDAAAGNLVAQLQRAGRHARFLALYTTVPASGLSPEAEDVFRHRAVSAVLVHSAKGAAAMTPLLDRFDVSGAHLVAVSEAAARPARGLDWKSVRAAEAPNEDALLLALQSA